MRWLSGVHRTTPENHGNPMIPDDVIRYLNEVAERTRLERELNPDKSFSDEENDDLAVINQNYPPGNFNQRYYSDTNFPLVV